MRWSRAWLIVVIVAGGSCATGLTTPSSAPRELTMSYPKEAKVKSSKCNEHPALALYRKLVRPLLDEQHKQALDGVDTSDTAGLDSKELTCRAAVGARGLWLPLQAIGWNGPANRLSFGEGDEQLRETLEIVASFAHQHAEGARQIKSCKAVEREIQEASDKGRSIYVPGLDFACLEGGGTRKQADRKLAIESLERLELLSNQALRSMDLCEKGSGSVEETVEAVRVLAEVERAGLEVFQGQFYTAPDIGIDSDPELMADSAIATLRRLAKSSRPGD